MKKSIYFIASLLLFSCSNRMTKSEMTTYRESSIEGAAISNNTDMEAFTTLEDSYSLLITEKIQDYLDKQILAKKHPEFNSENNVKELFKTIDSKEVLLVEFIGQPEKVSDSVTKLITKVGFTNTQTDTIYSYIKTATAVIDGVVFKTSKITFKEN